VIRLGDRFTAAFSRTFRQVADRMETGPAFDRRNIDLRVHSIIAYRRQFEEIGQGVYCGRTVSRDS
jgi:hypothetical protein